MDEGSIAVWRRLIDEQHRVCTFAEELTSLLGRAEPVDPADLARARWSFASRLMQHLAAKERHIYAKLEHDGRPEVATYFSNSKNDLLSRFQGYVRHMETWPTSQALAQWAAYRPKAIAVVDLFIIRLKREEGELLALLERYAIDITMPSPVTSNWVRQGFDVKASVEDGCEKPFFSQ